MKTSKKVGLVCSILIHILPLLFLISLAVPKGEGNNPKQENTVRVTLLPLKKENFPQQQQVGKTGKENQITVDEKICKDKDPSYEGVGFEYDPGTGIINNVPEFYPAYKAGVRLGDFLPMPYIIPKNGYLDFFVIRGYQKIYFHVKTEKICYMNR